MSFDRGHKSAASFVAVSLDAAKGFEGKLGIDGEDLLIAQKDCRVDCFSAAKAELHGVLRRRQGIFQQAFERDFAQDAAGFGVTEDRFKRLLRVGESTAGFLK